MHPDAYHRFTARLQQNLSADERVIGLVALGSMSGEPPAADEWSDHDFFVVTRPGEQERMRTDLSWLPDAGDIAFAHRETAHGLKVFYGNSHLLEFAVFDREELWLARVNRFQTLLDRGGVDERMRAVRGRTAQEPRPGVSWLWGQFLGAVLVGAGRYRRGERLSGRALLQSAAAYLVQLIAKPADALDPLRRVEQTAPDAARDIDAALACPPAEGAVLLLRIAIAAGAPDAARALERYLAA
jgi:hypothetical protein